jgi:hypothetical protein
MQVAPPQVEIIGIEARHRAAASTTKTILPHLAVEQAGNVTGQFLLYRE